jgi:hypothetical protein
VERFRGKDDQAAVVEEQLAKSNKLTDHLIGWFTAELGGEPGFDGLKTFMDTQLRADLKNVALYGWESLSVSELASPAEAKHPMLLRMLQYLAERKYFTPSEVPEVARAAAEVTMNSPKRLLGRLQRIAADKMGVAPDAAIPAKLAFLGDMAQVKESLRRYLKTTDEYKAALATWEQEKRENKDNVETQQPDPEGLMDPPLMMQGLLYGSYTDDHRVTVSLETGVEAFWTNGTWDAESGAVTWSGGLPYAELWPKLLFALWVRPDEAYQKEHFGKVVLSAGDLYTYCLWRASLSQDEGRQWDGFVAGLKGDTPGEQLWGKVGEFRFAGEPIAPEPGEKKVPDSYAKVATELIQKALPEPEKADEDSGPPPATGEAEAAPPAP